ncbi:Uncharacterised protein [Bordetella pertussis]|nr:Uncharacterised protein [Bordetella pertussis]
MTRSSPCVTPCVSSTWSASAGMPAAQPDLIGMEWSA